MGKGLEPIWSAGRDGADVPSFLVEGYLANPTPAALESLTRRARDLDACPQVRYLGSLVLPEDEVCFHVFEAASLGAVAAASERIDLAHERVVEAIWLPPTSA